MNKPKQCESKQCEACRVIENGKELHERFRLYRGYEICCRCIMDWKELEYNLGYDVEFQGFIKGGSKMGILLMR